MIQLRDAKPEDAKAVGAILTEFSSGTVWMPKLHSVEENLGFCQAMISRGWVRLAERAGQVLGFIARNADEVNALYVTQPSRGQGIGAAMIDEAKQASPSLSLWTFQDNLGARRFYAEHGFIEVERSDGAGNDEKLPDVKLLWTRKDRF